MRWLLSAFARWIDHPVIGRHLDACVGLHSNAADRARVAVQSPSEPRRVTSCAVSHSELYGAPLLVTRLLPTKCFWLRCTFCVINSAHVSDAVCATADAETRTYVDSLVQHLEAVGTFCYLELNDEAIACPVLCEFAEAVIARGIRVAWLARARVSHEFTPEVCRLLARSGLRVIMFGVESVSDRIVRLMDKRDRLYSVAELEGILDNCERNGIGTHVFCLFGFPSETKEETNETARFVERNLAARPFFTFSANQFALQRGCEVHRRPGAYGIEVVDQPDSLRLSHLQFRDMNPGERYTREEVFALTKRLYAKLFFKDVPDAATAELGFQLFDFIDRTGAFHDHRLANTTNPYYRRAAHASLAPALLDRRCRLIPPVDLDGEGGVLLDPIEDEVLRVGEVVKQAMRHLVAHFDAGRTLRANVDEAWAAAATLLPEGAADCREWDDLVLRLINTSAIYPA